MLQTETGTATKSLIWRDMEIKGNIDCKGAICIEGKHVGDIKCQTLEVGEQAVIEGNITANDMKVSGKIKGEVRAVDLVIASSAHIEGKLIYKSLGMEEGALLEGELKRADNPLA